MKEHIWWIAPVVGMIVMTSLLFGCTTYKEAFCVVASCDTLEKINSANVILDDLVVQPACGGFLLQYSIGPALRWNVDKMNSELIRLGLPQHAMKGKTDKIQGGQQ